MKYYEIVWFLRDRIDRFHVYRKSNREKLQRKHWEQTNRRTEGRENGVHETRAYFAFPRESHNQRCASSVYRRLKRLDSVRTRFEINWITTRLFQWNCLGAAFRMARFNANKTISSNATHRRSTLSFLCPRCPSTENFSFSTALSTPPRWKETTKRVRISGCSLGREE